MSDVKNLPSYDESKEVPLSTVEAGRECLLRIEGAHALYSVCKVGNSPIFVDCPEHQPNKRVIICNLASGRLVNKHPAQRVVPVFSKVVVKG